MSKYKKLFTELNSLIVLNKIGVHGVYARLKEELESCEQELIQAKKALRIADQALLQMARDKGVR